MTFFLQRILCQNCNFFHNFLSKMCPNLYFVCKTGKICLILTALPLCFCLLTKRTSYWTNLVWEKDLLPKNPYVWFVEQVFAHIVNFSKFLSEICQICISSATLAFFPKSHCMVPLIETPLFWVASQASFTSKVLSFFKNKHAFRKQITEVHRCSWRFLHTGYCQTDMCIVLCMFEKRVTICNVNPQSNSGTTICVWPAAVHFDLNMLTQRLWFIGQCRNWTTNFMRHHTAYL